MTSFPPTTLNNYKFGEWEEEAVRRCGFSSLEFFYLELDIYITPAPSAIISSGRLKHRVSHLHPLLPRVPLHVISSTSHAYMSWIGYRSISTALASLSTHYTSIQNFVITY